MAGIVISDTSCLIILDKIGQISLLQACYDSVLVTPEVAREYGQPLPDWISIQSPKNTSLIQLLEETIDPGESSAIALSLEIEDCILVLDDLRARKVAKAMEIPFTGTLGIIASAKQRGIIPLARPLFEQISKTDFRISEKFMEAILAELGE